MLFCSFSLSLPLLAQESEKTSTGGTNVEIIDHENQDIDVENRTFSEKEKELLGDLLSELGVTEDVNEILETKNIRIVLEDKEVNHEQTSNFSNANIQFPETKRAFLGVYYDVNKEDKGVAINKVIEGTSAEEMGLESGDVIERFNGEDVNFENLRKLIGEMEPGERVKLSVIRDGKKKTIKGKIGEKEHHYQFSRTHSSPGFHSGNFRIKTETKKTSRPMLGVTLKETDGVVEIQSIIENSPAQQMGLKEGDILKEVNGISVEHISSVTEGVKKSNVGETIEVDYERDGAQLNSSAEMKMVEFTPNVRHIEREYKWNGSEEDAKELLEKSLEIKEMEVEMNELAKTFKTMKFTEMPTFHHTQMYRNQPTREFIISGGSSTKEESILDDEGVVEDAFEIYPNPNDGKFNIEFQAEKGEETEVKVFDASNKLIYQRKYQGNGALIKEEIDVSQNPKGVYIIQIESGNNMEVRKVIFD